MVCNIHIATLGHEPKSNCVNKGPIIESVQNYQNVATLHLLCSVESDADEIRRDLAIFRKLQIDGHTIDPYDFSDIIGTIVEIHRSEVKVDKEARFFVNVTGGTKIMSCAALVGANYIGAMAYYVKEQDGQSIELSPPKVPPTNLTTLQKNIVKAIDSAPMTQTEIGRHLKESVQKINFNCKSLRRSGYLIISRNEKDGRATRIQLTSMGQMALRALK